MSKSASSAAAPKHPPYPEQAPRFLPLETVRVHLAAPPHTDRRPVFGIISNMSETGACIITNLTLPEGTTVELTIESRHKKSALVVSARASCGAPRDSSR
jgi:hypothetical protein